MTALKMSASRWRTWGGERFECWSTEWNSERVKRYRAGGLRVRRFEGETFLRVTDFSAAGRIDDHANLAIADTTERPAEPREDHLP